MVKDSDAPAAEGFDDLDRFELKRKADLEVFLIDLDHIKHHQSKNYIYFIEFFVTLNHITYSSTTRY